MITFDTTVGVRRGWLLSRASMMTLNRVVALRSGHLGAQGESSTSSGRGADAAVAIFVRLQGRQSFA